LKPGVSELDGLKQKLTRRLAPRGVSPDWEVIDLISVWWRPTFDSVLYPYIPPHVTQPKECRKIFLVALPESFAFTVPSNQQLVAVPLIDVRNNLASFGEVISSLPACLSRFDFILGEEPSPSVPDTANTVESDVSSAATSSTSSTSSSSTTTTTTTTPVAAPVSMQTSDDTQEETS